MTFYSTPGSTGNWLGAVRLEKIKGFACTGLDRPVGISRTFNLWA
jgi:hypothetical protein